MKSTISILVLIAIFLASCSAPGPDIHGNNKRTKVQDSYQNSRLALSAIFVGAGQLFKLKGRKQQTVETVDGSKIHVPENAFVLKSDGTPVEGGVELEYIDYNSKGRIIASDIPMVYTDEKGEKQQFESAGMFELKATQGDRELKLAEGKEIEVELATDVEGSFNLYQLNEDRTDWELKDTDCKAVRNKNLDDVKKELEDEVANQPLPPKKPVEYKKGDRLFDVKLYNYHSADLAQLNGVMWKFTGEDSKEDPVNIGSFTENYNMVYLEPVDTNILEYKLHFESRKDTLDIKAVPVFKGKLLDKENARVRKMFSELNKSLAKQQKMRERLKREKKLLRMFRVSELGVYNHDINYFDPETVVFNASVRLENGPMPEEISMFFLPTNRRVVTYFTKDYLAAFGINPMVENKLVAIDAESNIYYVSSKDIRKMRLSRKKNGDKVEFVFKKHKQSKSVDELDELITSI